MASRWLAMICACHTKAMDMKLIDTTQKTRTITTLDSWTGRLRTRRSQVMVGALLVLGSPAIALLCESESAAPGDVACACLSQGNREARTAARVGPLIHWNL